MCAHLNLASIEGGTSNPHQGYSVILAKINFSILNVAFQLTIRLSKNV